MALGEDLGSYADPMVRSMLAAVSLGLFFLSGCASHPPSVVPAISPDPMVSASATPARGPVSASPTPSAPPLSGTVIVIDAGHTGGWSSAWGYRQVPNGTGGTKPCNSSGTATRSGYAEHAYNFDQAAALAKVLRARGARVVLNRTNDTTATDDLCVNHRADKANQHQADLLISLHADGNEGREHRGFHIIISTAMRGGPKVMAASQRLAGDLRHSLESETDLPRSNYIGGGTAYSQRSDIATLNFAERPAVMLEMGNMMNDADAARFSSHQWRAQAAVALADGIQAFLT